MRSLSEACRIRWATDNGSKMMIQKWVTKPFGNAPILLVGCFLEDEAIIRFHTGKEAVVCARKVGYDFVVGDKKQDYHSGALCDLAIAMDHITLAAVEEGLGTCWVGAFDEVKVKQILSIPSSVRVGFLMSIGYPAEWPASRSRKPIETLICYERYS
jgi:nitroreductase